MTIVQQDSEIYQNKSWPFTPFAEKYYKKYHPEMCNSQKFPG